MRIGLFYGSSTGNTRRIAEQVESALGLPVQTCRSVEGLTAHDLLGHDLLILGTSTWSVGELQSHWEELFPSLDEVDLGGTPVALFGVGDQESYPDHYCDAMGILHAKLVERGARVGVGCWSAEGYTLRESLSLHEGRFCGLPLDEDNQAHLTEERVRTWCDQLRHELGLAAATRRRTRRVA